MGVLLRDQRRKKTWSNRSCRFYPQSQCALGYCCNFKHLESDAPPGWSFAELRNDGDVRGIPVTNRKACCWRDGACRYGNSCKHVRFRHAWAPENMAPSTTNRPEQPQPRSGTSQSQWPGFAPSQSTGNAPSPAVAQPSSQDGATSTPAPDRDAWVTMVTRILPLMVPQERSGTKREQIAGMRDGFKLLAAHFAELPPHRQVPATNPTGTCMPSASIGSITQNQPQTETQVYPFSQCKQVVTESNMPEEQESSTQVPTGNRPS